LGPSGIDENNTFQLKCLFYHRNCGSHSFGRLLCVRVGVAACWNKLALRKKLKNLHAKSQYPSSYSFRNCRAHPTDRQTDMARSTRLVILIKNIYTLWVRNIFLLPVTYFPTNLVYPFTLRVTGIKGLAGICWYALGSWKSHFKTTLSKFITEKLQKKNIVK